MVRGGAGQVVRIIKRSPVNVRRNVDGKLSLTMTLPTIATHGRRIFMSATAKGDLSENAYAHVFAGWNTPRSNFNNAVFNATLSGQTALNAASADTARTLLANTSPQKQNADIDDCGQRKVMISVTPPNPGHNYSAENAMNSASVRKAVVSTSKAVKPSLSKNKTVVANINDINTIV